jgi:hypothetical protein
MKRHSSIPALLFSTFVLWSIPLLAQPCKEYETVIFYPQEGDWSWTYFNYQDALDRSLYGAKSNDHVKVEIFNSNEIAIDFIKWIGMTGDGEEKQYGWFQPGGSTIRPGTKGEVRFAIAPQHVNAISRAWLTLANKSTQCAARYSSSEISAMRAAEKQKEEQQVIFDNCVIDKAKDNPGKHVLAHVYRECQRIADDPGFIDKWKYRK